MPVIADILGFMPALDRRFSIATRSDGGERRSKIALSMKWFALQAAT
jgi:hypothetical protein